MRYRKAVLILFMFLVYSGCDDKTKKVVSSMESLAKSVGQVQENTRVWFKADLISQETALDILAMCDRINVSIDQVAVVLEMSGELDGMSARTIVKLLSDLSLSIDPAELEFIANIRDPDTKTTFEGLMVAIRAGIASTQIVLASIG